MLTVNSAPSNLGRNQSQKQLRKEQDVDGDYQKRKKARVLRDRVLDAKITKCVNAQPMTRFAYNEYGATFAEDVVEAFSLLANMRQGTSLINEYEGASVTPLSAKIRIGAKIIPLGVGADVPGVMLTLLIIQNKASYTASEVLASGGTYRAIAPINQVPLSKYTVLRTDMLVLDQFRPSTVTNFKIKQAEMIDVEFNPGFTYGNIDLILYVSLLEKASKVEFSFRSEVSYTA